MAVQVRAKHGTTNDNFTFNVDLAPTILNAAGISAPTTMQGRDMSPLYLAADPAQAARMAEMRSRFAELKAAAR